MKLNKIKWHKGEMRIEYSRVSFGAKEKEFKETVFKGYDEPTEGFTKALQALLDEVEKICEFPSGYLTKKNPRSHSADGRLSYGQVIGVSISHQTDDVFGATITVLRDLDTANAPLVINTPHLPSYSENGLALSDETVWKIENLMACAYAYLRGERKEKQEKLFEDASSVAALIPPNSNIESVSISSGEHSFTLTKAEADELRQLA